MEVMKETNREVFTFQNTSKRTCKKNLKIRKKTANGK